MRRANRIRFVLPLDGVPRRLLGDFPPFFRENGELVRLIPDKGEYITREGRRFVPVFLYDEGAEFSVYRLEEI